MEAKLRDALDRAAFECAVVRVEPGVYNFGPSVQAVVELSEAEEVLASRDGGPFEPIDEFILRVVEEGRRNARMAGALEDSSCGPAPAPAVPAVPAVPAALAAPAEAAPLREPAKEPSREPTAREPTREPTISPRAVSPGPLTAPRYVTTASPRPQHWQTAPAAAGAGVAPGQQSAQWAAVPAIRAASPTGYVRTAARQAGVVPSLALPGHAGPMIVGHQSSSTTPERPRARGLHQGLPTTANTAAPGQQLFSPRPQGVQKAPVSQVANPRLLMAANAGSMRMGMPQAVHLSRVAVAHAELH